VLVLVLGAPLRPVVATPSSRLPSQSLLSPFLLLLLLLLLLLVLSAVACFNCAGGSVVFSGP
jgi:hypothetical protein